MGLHGDKSHAASARLAGWVTVTDHNQPAPDPPLGWSAAAAANTVPSPEAPSPGEPASGGPPRLRIGQLEILTVILLVLLVGQRWLAGAFTAPVVQTWATVFVAIVVQATPFLVLGVALSAAIAAFVPAGVIARALPRRDTLAVPVAGLSAWFCRVVSARRCRWRAA